MLNLKQYLIKEHVGMMKLTDVYDIIDPATKAKVGEAREEIRTLTKLLRLVVNKKLFPTCISVYQGVDPASQQLLFSIRRGMALFAAKVQIEDASGHSLGYLQSKMFSVGGAFRVFNTQGTQVAEVKGDWKGWNFRFLSGTKELGVVTKKWAGLGKELFTSADTYIIDIHGEQTPALSVLLLAAGLAIDTVYKEKG